MKANLSLFSFLVCCFILIDASGQTSGDASVNQKKLYIDVHEFGPGKVKFDDVAEAHLKDLAVEKKHNVHFINYWVDEEHGLIYCLSSAGDSGSIRDTHKEAHGLLPAYTFEVTEGQAAALTGNKNLFLDIHKLGTGRVTATAVAEAHKKDLAVQDKYGVNFINYWVDEKAGIIFCLSEAKSAESIIDTHKEAHGLTPVEIRKVKQGE